jgi:hypothetical protein
MIVDDEEFHSDDFTVVLQPFMENIDAPRKVMALTEIHPPSGYSYSIIITHHTLIQENGKIDMSYFAVDCFHFRTKGHRIAAAALWNNMVSSYIMYWTASRPLR